MVTKVKKPNNALALMTPDDLVAQSVAETAKRKILTDFIAKHLKRGIDYGAIHIAKNCANKHNCTNKYHFSKDVLFKPGAEKFCSLFKLRAEFKKDTDTWEMLGSKPGEVAYLCQLYTTDTILVGEGRGVASVTEKGNSNTAVKIAEKRAKLDAVLSTGALSDFFTQDLEDMQPTEAEPEVEDVPTVDLGQPTIWPGNKGEVMEAIKIKPKKEVSNETKIAHLLKLLGISMKDANLEIHALTQLLLTEANYPEIISRLETIVKERKEAEKQNE